MLAAAGATLWSWRGDLPHPIATHWGADGTPNGFQSLGLFLAFFLGLMAGIVVLFTAIGVGLSRYTGGLRVMVAANLYIGTMGLLLALLTVGPQRGLASAAEAALPGWVVAVSMLVPILPALVGAALVRRVPVPASALPVPAGASMVPTVGGEVPAWSGSTTVNPVGMAVGGILLLGLFGGIALGMRSWWMLLLGALVMGLVLSMMAFSIRADASGLVVRSWMGWPRKTVRADQVQEASVVAVSPFGEFGGWGYRFGFGGGSGAVEGIVVRGGQGIRVRYGQSSTLVVTVNRDAEGAAATLNTAAAEARRR